MRVELIQPHEHAGRTYPPGSMLELPDDSAEWLIAIDAAKPATSDKPKKGTAQ